VSNGDSLKGVETAQYSFSCCLLASHDTWGFLKYFGQVNWNFLGYLGPLQILPREIVWVLVNFFDID
jgi:hypothetical protein